MSMFKDYYNKRRTFIKIFSITFIFIFIAVYGIGLLYYKNTSSRLVDEYNKNSRNLLYQAKTAIDIIVDTMAFIPYTIYEDKKFLAKVRNVSQIDEVERSNILDTLNNVKNSNKYTESVVLYLPAGEIVFSTNYGLCPLKDFPDRDWIKDNSVSDTELRFINKRVLVKSNHNNSENKNVFTLIKSIPYSPSMNAVLIVNFDIDKIYDSIVSKLNLNNDTEIFAISKSGDIVFKNNRSKLLDDVLPNKNFKNIFEKNQQNSEVVINGKKYFITAIFSEYINSYVVWISSYEELNNTITTISNIIVISSTVLLLLLVLVSVYILNRTSKPIDELLSFVLSKWNSSQAKLNIYGIANNIVKETFNNYSELQGKMDRMIPFFKERLLYSLMTRSDLNSDEIRKRLEENEISFDYKWFYVLSVDILNLYRPDENDRNPSLMRLVINETFSNMLQGDRLATYKVDVDDEKIAIILNTDEEDISKSRNDIEVLLRSICQLLEDKLGIETAIGISERSDCIYSIAKLYKSSINALNYRLVGNTNNIVFIDSVDQRQEGFEKFDDLFEERLENSILVGNTEQAVNIVREVFAEYREEKEITALSFQNGVLYLTTILAKIASKIDFDLIESTYKVKIKNIFQIISDLKTINEAEMFFVTVVENMCGSCLKMTETDRDYYNNKIIEYIDNNYREDISIDSASQVIGISSSYIFKILKEKSKMSFTEYIASKRVMEACRLLKANYKVQEIAGRIGYSSSAYFIHVFKKLMGCTPNEYRKLNG